MVFKSDIQIAQECEKKQITEIAATFAIPIPKISIIVYPPCFDTL